MIIEQHYDEEVLAEFLAEPADSVTRDKHLASCGLCARTLDSLRTSAAVLREPAVWDKTQISTTSRPETIAFLRNVQKTMRDEADLASVWIKQLLAGPRETWTPRLEEHPEWRTAGMVRALIRAREEATNTVPADALEISKLGVAIADQLDASVSNRQLRGQAHYSYGYAAWYTGANPEALAAFDRADELFSAVDAAEFDRALVTVMRAMIYQVLERRDEALSLSREAAAVFARYGDSDRYAMARTTAAFTLQAAQRHRDALAVHLELAAMRGLSEKWRAAIAHNTALCYVELNDLDRAKECLLRAVAGYERLGMFTFRSRVRWSLADVFAKQALHPQAVELYAELRQEFEDLQMANEVALLSLDMAESLLVLGRLEEISRVCKASLAYFGRAGMSHTEPALRGLAYLQEAAVAGKLTTAAIHDVRALILAPPAERSERLYLEVPR